jgi:hypothetical protein
MVVGAPRSYLTPRASALGPLGRSYENRGPQSKANADTKLPSAEEKGMGRRKEVWCLYIWYMDYSIATFKNDPPPPRPCVSVLGRIIRGYPCRLKQEHGSLSSILLYVAFFLPSSIHTAWLSYASGLVHPPPPPPNASPLRLFSR